MLPLQLRPKPSRYLTYVVVFTWLGLLGLLFAAAINLWLVAVFALSSALLYWRWLRTYAWLQATDSLQAIKINTTGWHLRLLNGTHITAFPATGCRFWPGLIVLRLRKLEGGIFWWILLADSADLNSLRRLRMAGRWGPKYKSEEIVPLVE